MSKRAQLTPIEHVIGRLNNWKFEQAHSLIEEICRTPGHPSYPNMDARVIIEALSNTFGNVGGFTGTFSTIVQAATARAIELLGGKAHE
jgi:hypothetical protein